MTEADLEITAEILKNRFIGKVEKAHTLLDVFQDHNRKMESLIGQKFEKSTFQRFETALMHTRDFIQLQYNVSDIPINQNQFLISKRF